MSAAWALDVAVRATAVAFVAVALASALRDRTAAARHAVFSFAVLTLLALPLLTTMLPRLELPVLPPPSSAAPSVVPKEAVDDEPFEAASAEPVGPVAFTEAEDLPVARAATAVPSTSPWSWSTWLLLIWATGAAAGLLQLVTSAWLVRRIAANAAPMDGEGWARHLAGALSRLRVRQRVRLVKSASVAVPVVWGYRHGVVMLPPDAEQWPDERKHAFLLHELAHVVRHDCLTQTLAHVTRVLYWPHPLVWWLVRRLRAEAERACDDRVVTAGTSGTDYAHHLLEAARALKRAPRPVAVLAVAERSSLEDRLLALLDPGLRRGALTTRALVLGAALCVLLAGSAAALHPVARAALDEAAAMLPVAAPEVAPTAAAESQPMASDRIADASTIGGVVTGPNGEGIAGALVLLGRTPTASDPLYRHDPPVAARTDATGAFRLALRETAPSHWLRVEAGGFVSHTDAKAQAGAPLSIALARGTKVIEGVVRELETRAPMARVPVVARDAPSFTAPLEAPHAGTVRTTTNTNGRFRITGLGGGPYSVSVLDPRQQLAPASVADGTKDVELMLPKGTSLTGTVSDLDGRPVAEASIALQGIAPTRASATAVTDERGRYEFPSVERGRYRVLGAAPGRAPAISETVNVEGGAAARVDVQLARSFVMKGRLVDAAGKPVAGAVRLQQLAGESRVPSSVAAALSARARADGRFEIAHLPSGTHVFEATAAGLVPRRLELRATETGAGNLGDVVMAAGQAIRGRVLDPAGQPVVGAAVTARRDGRNKANVRSDSDGSFVLAVPDAGAHDLRVEAAGFAVEARRAETGADPVDLRLTRGSGMAGQLVDGDGKPVTTRSVEIRAIEPRSGQEPSLTARPPRNDDGSFRVDDLAPGRYALTIHGEGCLPHDVAEVTVDAERQTDLGRITVARGGSVQGVVVDREGRPVGGATVSAVQRVFLPPAGQRISGIGQRPRTDAEGRFELSGLPAGRFSVRASHPSYVEGNFVDVTIGGDKGGTPLRLVLTEGGRIVGKVRQRRPGAGFPMFVGTASVEIQPGYSGYLMPRTHIADDGSFVLEHVRQGPVRVTLLANEEPSFHPPLFTKHVVVREGETTAVDFGVADVRVHGRVTRGGQPIAHAQLGFHADDVAVRFLGAEIQPGARPERLRAAADADGRYEMIVPVAARYRVKLWAPEPAALPDAAREIDVPATDAFRFDVELSDATFSGVVLDAETKSPVKGARVTAGEPGVDGEQLTTGEDGRFRMRLDAGAYDLQVTARDYAREKATVEVSASRDVEKTLELRRGLHLKVRVLDSTGHPVDSPNLVVMTNDSRIERTARGDAQGVVEIRALNPGRYTVLAASLTHGFGVLRNVAPGADGPVTITTSPGRRVRLGLSDETGQPLANARMSYLLTRLDDTVIGVAPTGQVRRGYSYEPMPTTDAAGLVEAVLPVGRLELVVESSSGQVGTLELDTPAEGSRVPVTLRPRR